MKVQEIVCIKIHEKYVDYDGILSIKSIEGAHMDLDSIKEDGLVNMRLTNNKRSLALSDSRPFFLQYNPMPASN